MLRLIKKKIALVGSLLMLMVWPVMSASLALAASSVTITSPTSNEVFFSGSFTATGTATSGKAVTVKVDGNTVGITLATGGNWSLNISGVAAGSHSLSAQVSDGPYAYITDFVDNATDVIDTGSNTVVTNIAMGTTGAVGVAYKPDGSKIYISGFATSNNVSVVDAATNAVETTIAVGNTPAGVAVNPSGSKAYVTNYGDTTVSILDLANNTMTGTINIGSSPFGVVFSPDGSKAYVGYADSGNVAVIDTATDTVTATVPTGGQMGGIDTNADGSRVYVAVQNTATVAVINATNNTLMGTINTCVNAQNLVHTKQSNRLVVTCSDNSDMAVFNTAGDANTQIGSNLVLGNHPYGVDYSKADPNIVYVTDGAQGFGNTVYTVDITGPTMLGTITVGNAPIALGRFIPPASTTSSTANFSVTGSGSGDSGTNPAGGEQTLPRVGMLLFTPVALALVVTLGFVYYDYRRHRRALTSDAIGPPPVYTFHNHVARVTIPRLRYRLSERFS